MKLLNFATWKGDVYKQKFGVTLKVNTSKSVKIDQLTSFLGAHEVVLKYSAYFGRKSKEDKKSKKRKIR